MKLEVKEQIKIEDGVHQGAIIGIEYREDPYDYTDLIIEFKYKDQDMKLKAGYVTYVSEGSKLGKLLVRFGLQLEVGISVDPDKHLIGKKCQFMTITEKGKNDTEYAKVIPDSVKPA